MHSEPNFSLPWQRRRQYSSTSSGFAIPGHRRILTNAHSVDHFTQVGRSRHVGRYLALFPCTCWRHMLHSSVAHAAWHLGTPLLLCRRGSMPASLSVQVKVRRRGSESKFVAKVLAVGAECDIGEPCRGLQLFSAPHCMCHEAQHTSAFSSWS